MVKYCPVCGSVNDDNARFCFNCGSRLPEGFNAQTISGKAFSDSRVSQSLPVSSLSLVPALYENWYKKNGAGLLTTFLLVLLFPILFIGSSGVLSPFIPFQAVFFILFLIDSYFLGVLIDSIKVRTVVILFVFTFFVLAPLTMITITISYNNTKIIIPGRESVYFLVYFFQFILSVLAIIIGTYNSPVMRVSLYSEKKLPQLIRHWSNYSKGELNRYFYPIKCSLLSEYDFMNHLEKKGRVKKGMGTLGIPITNQHGGAGCGGGGGGGFGGGGGGFDSGGVFWGGDVGSGGGYSKKPLLKVREHPYEARAGFTLEFEGVKAYLVLKLHKVREEWDGYHIVEVIYDIYLPANRKLTKSEFIQNYITNIIRGADNFIYANAGFVVT